MVSLPPPSIPSSARRQSAERYVCVVLHDVAALRWTGCLRIWALMHQLAMRTGVQLPVTLLVVPQMHGSPPTPPQFLQWLRQTSRRGHELALHGDSRVAWSADRPWRRLGSAAWSLAWAATQRRAPVLRLELHPSDADHAVVRWCWSVLLSTALRRRRPVRLSEAADLSTGGAIA